MIIDIDGLTKVFGETTALNIPEWHMGSGEVVGLVGSNGAGKSTFLRLLLDLIPATTGTVRMNGETVVAHSEWKAHTGSFLDTSFLIDYLTSDEYFTFVGSLYGFSPEETQTALFPFQAFYPDETFGRTTRFIRDMSVGNAKKIGIIAAMFVRPRLLLLDEPFANLDPPSQIRLKQMLRAMHLAHCTTMIISSHDLGHVTEISQRISLLETGQIVRDTPISAATLSELETYFAS